MTNRRWRGPPSLATVTVLYPVDCPATARVQPLADALAVQENRMRTHATAQPTPDHPRSTAYYPSDGDRVITTHHAPGTPKSCIGTVTDVTPFEQDEYGTWMGGWMFTGREMGPGGKRVHTAMACPEAVLLHHGVRQSVRLATPADETA